MITLEEVVKNINLASIPAIEEIGKQIAELWKESHESNAVTETPDNASISLKDITTLWNRLRSDTVERSATHSDSKSNETTTRFFAAATESISAQASEKILSSSENTSSENATLANVKEVVNYVSESVKNAQAVVSSVSEALKSESAASASTSTSMSSIRDISSADFGVSSESISSLKELRETLTNALGIESQQSTHATQSVMNSQTSSESLLFNTMATPETAMLSPGAVNYGGDTSYGGASTNVTMSGITITVNGNDGESVANSIANNLVAKTQQAYMGDGSVGR